MPVNLTLGVIPRTSKYSTQLSRMRKSNQWHSKSVPGRPSVGGRRTSAAFYQCCSKLVASAPAGAGPNRLLPSCASHSTGCAGRPSCGGRRTDICLPPGIRTVVGLRVPRVYAIFSKLTTVGIPPSVRQPALVVWHGQEPNRSFNRTLHGLPAFGLNKPSPNAVNPFRAG